MKFDKSKILTVVTADQLKEGQLGWINDTVDYLKSDIQIISSYKVFSTNKNIVDFPFTAEDRGIRRYFYPASELTYAERQAEWVIENDVKAGTKVRVTRTFTGDEDGSWCWEHDDLVGMTGSVNEYGINTHNLGVTMSDGNSRAIPYFVLEVIKEPTYEERQAEWVRQNNARLFTKVRFTKGFNKAEDGSDCCEHRDAKGMEGYIDTIEKTWLFVNVLGGSIWSVPFTALEAIKEPTYRPYNNNELNDIVGEVLTNKKSGRRKLVTGKSAEASGVNLDGGYITAEDLLSSFYRNTNEPCGIKE